MIEPDSPQFDACCEQVVNQCKKIVRAYHQHHLGADFICETLVVKLVEVPACCARCLDTLPREVTMALFSYCERELLGTNFMPNPLAYLPQPASEEAIRMKKMEMQSPYRLLFQAVKDHLNRAGGS